VGQNGDKSNWCANVKNAQLCKIARLGGIPLCDPHDVYYVRT
jgi:hypothetical protein